LSSRRTPGPTSASRLLQRLGLLRITYIYRDPRDAMLSAYDYGQRALKKGRPNAFSHLTDFQRSLDFILDYVRIWEKWMKEKACAHRPLRRPADQITITK
jgi:hypothetical protein